MDLDLYTLKRTETHVLNSLDLNMESRLSILGIEGYCL